MKYGWYSEKMAAVCGSVTFAIGDGEVKVTTVTDSDHSNENVIYNRDHPGSRWGDEQLMFMVDPHDPEQVCLYLGGELKSWREEEQLDKKRHHKSRKPKHSASRNNK